MNPLAHPTYPWAQAVAIGYDEPGCTHINLGYMNIAPVDELTAVQTLFDTWDASYPNRSSRN
jgi:hypothetical protein